MRHHEEQAVVTPEMGPGKENEDEADIEANHYPHAQLHILQPTRDRLRVLFALGMGERGRIRCRIWFRWWRVRRLPREQAGLPHHGLFDSIGSQSGRANPRGEQRDLYDSILPVVQPFSAILTVETAASSSTLSCPTGTDCASYSLEVPAGGAYVGAYSTSGPTLTQTAALASYTIDGVADTCTPVEVKSQMIALSGTGPFNTAIGTALGFAACQ